CAPEAALAHAETFPSRAAEYGPNMRAFLDVGRMITGMQRAEVDFASRQFSGALAALFERVDLIAVPVVSAIGMTLDRIAALAGDADSFAEFLRFTAPFDFSGSPTITMPCGFEPDGVPIGFQLVGPHLAEDRLIAAGRAFQAATDWHRQHPSV